MTYNVVIVEDEKHNLEYLEGLMDQHRDYRVVGRATGVEDAHARITETRPDLVLMDVIIQGGTSFNLLELFGATSGKVPFEIIFTTSYAEYAVKALRQSAIDYLLKPVNPDELKVALEKFSHKKRDSSLEQLKVLMHNIGRQKADRLCLPTLTGFITVAIPDVVRCESDNTYTTFHMSDKRKIIVSKTLKEYEQLLEEHNFQRVHNSHLVNLEHVREYLKGEGGTVRMSDGSEVDVSRRRKDDFRRRFGF